jgi:hypothetical protein
MANPEVLDGIDEPEHHEGRHDRPLHEGDDPGHALQGIAAERLPE